MRSEVVEVASRTKFFGCKLFMLGLYGEAERYILVLWGERL